MTAISSAERYTKKKVDVHGRTMTYVEAGRSEAFSDQHVVRTVPQALQHGFVHLLHQLADVVLERVGVELGRVVLLLRRQDVAAVKQVRDDVRIGGATVLGLDVEQQPAVANVRIEARDSRLMSKGESSHSCWD